MIPKTIHYCWFGRNPKPKLAKKCIKSWKKHCPDYQIIEWNEDNYDVSKIAYTQEAYDAKKWAYVTDYARLDILYHYGGVYLDTDVELIQSLDSLLNNRGFAGFESPNYVATGLGIGAEKGNEIIRLLKEDYETRSFRLSDGTINQINCPVLDTDVLERLGLVRDGSKQTIDGFTFYPQEYFCPLSYETRKFNKTKSTFSIHWYAGTWVDPEVKKKETRQRRKRKREERIDYIIHLPNRLANKLLGQERYDRLKKRLKG